MEAAHLIAFNAALLAAWIAPGPAMLYALKTALAESGAAEGFMKLYGLSYRTWGRVRRRCGLS